MDVTLAKTFLAIADTGSFMEAADRLHVTQSAVSMRIKSLEDALGRKLFQRSKAGASLTPAGQQFQRHATAILRVWQHAQLEVSLADQHSDHLAIGAQISLWEGFLLDWVAKLREQRPDLAVTASFAASQVLIERLVEGTIDIAVAYRAVARPGIEVEHLMDDELVLVSSEPRASTRSDRSYVFVNWGPEFAADHADTYPQLSKTGLHLDLGAVGINYLFKTQSSGYFPLRVVQPFLQKRKLTIIKRARRFVYPVYLAYPEERNEEAFAPILESLRVMAASTPGA
jgi:DNA-binding transcriptional LysR family regulator